MSFSSATHVKWNVHELPARLPGLFSQLPIFGVRLLAARLRFRGTRALLRQRPFGMTSSSGLHLKTYSMILIMVIFGPLGNTLLGKGMKNLGSANSWSPAELPHIFVRIFTSPFIWLGVASLLTFFVAYMLILSWADFSYVQPASSVAYLVVAVLGYFYLGERISGLHWFGVLIICLGVLVVGNTPPRTTQVPPP